MPSPHFENTVCKILSLSYPLKWKQQVLWNVVCLFRPCLSVARWTEFARLFTIVYFVHFFGNYKSSKTVLGHSCPQLRLRINFGQKWHSIHFGRIFHKLVWSPCSSQLRLPSIWLGNLLQIGFKRNEKRMHKKCLSYQRNEASHGLLCYHLSFWNKLKAYVKKNFFIFRNFCCYIWSELTWVNSYIFL
jgi:hypothetical protein